MTTEDTLTGEEPSLMRDTRVMVGGVSIGFDVPASPADSRRYHDTRASTTQAEQFQVPGASTIEGEHLSQVVAKRQKTLVERGHKPRFATQAQEGSTSFLVVNRRRTTPATEHHEFPALRNAPRSVELRDHSNHLDLLTFRNERRESTRLTERRGAVRHRIKTLKLRINPRIERRSRDVE